MDVDRLQGNGNSNTQQVPQEQEHRSTAEGYTMDNEEKLLGATLFDMAFRVTLDGTRHQRPELNEAEALAVLRERLRLARNLERNSGVL
ncbi:MAG: hypothetical protein KDB27_27515 [Planctomycetales bacterium]|nr:hypothetical protein [Planctomycetales bacterium]